MNSEPQPLLQWIEVAGSLGIPSFQIIGLPSPEVAESRERVRAAIDASGLEFPRKRVVVNLSPASVRKRGTGVDLAVALAVLSAEASEDGHAVGIDRDWIAWGELGLDGTVKAAPQVTRAVYAAWAAGARYLVLSADSLRTARQALALMDPVRFVGTPPPQLIPVANLGEAWARISATVPDDEEIHEQATAGEVSDGGSATPRVSVYEGSLLPLPKSLERLIGVAVAGSHHLLLLGPKGTGKSHALEWMIALQPPPTPAIRLENLLLAELSSAEATASASTVPVRRVNSGVKPAALLGQATAGALRPGEFTLAHGGLLIADELPEWARDAREAMREPLERGRLTLTRAGGQFELPARFTLAANGNLCPCGGWPPELPLPLANRAEGARPPRCSCSVSQRRAYLARLSGPILDRIDATSVVTLGGPQAPDGANASSRPMRLSELRAQVAACRHRLQARWGNPPGLLSGAEVEAVLASLPELATHLAGIRHATLRSRHKLTRLALTLAAWDEKDTPGAAHLMEAACYRPERFGLGD